MAWDRVDFTGKRVAVIGCGILSPFSHPPHRCAGKEPDGFQRTPNHSVPAQNKPL